MVPRRLAGGAFLGDNDCHYALVKRCRGTGWDRAVRQGECAMEEAATRVLSGQRIGIPFLRRNDNEIIGRRNVEVLREHAGHFDPNVECTGIL